VILVAILAALVVGFLDGLFAFKVKSRWCPVCGTSTVTLQHRHEQRATR
jgi:hypothetical protein